MTEMPTNPLQAMLNGMSAAWQRQRATSQMTLGDLITALEALPKDRRIRGVGRPMSYRGYYEDLAFDPVGESSVSEALEAARGCMGKTFPGYKGGEYTMGESTPIWSAAYGEAWRPRIVGLDTESDPIQLVTAPEEEATP